MENAELLVLILNLTIMIIAYFFIYPKFVGFDLNKLALNDLCASLISLIVSGSIFWGSNQEFNALFTTLNWFWFTILTYAAIEIPFIIWYTKKHYAGGR